MNTDSALEPSQLDAESIWETQLAKAMKIMANNPAQFAKMKQDVGSLLDPLPKEHELTHEQMLELAGYGFLVVPYFTNVEMNLIHNESDSSKTTANFTAEFTHPVVITVEQAQEMFSELAKAIENI